MINSKSFIRLVALLCVIVLFNSCSEDILDPIKSDEDLLSERIKKPYLGWNSYDSYGNEIDIEQALENLELFVTYLKPYGYEYFCVDAGWDDVHQNVTYDEFGRQVASERFFPQGLQQLIDSVHAHGLKFGLWMARGMNKNAYHSNCTVKGTDISLKDIADTLDLSDWWPYNYGVDMEKPGAQEYYNSIFELLAELEVDFVKYDDIVPHPDEINAVRTAISNCGREIVLSLSPGDDASVENIDAYKLADMFRITSDVWDRWGDIEKGFLKWEEMSSFDFGETFLDLDMIPFGWIKRDGFRLDTLSIDEKRTFMTQRALAASPLIMGGALAKTDIMSYEIITNKEMLLCNQLVETGSLLSRDTVTKIDVWTASSSTATNLNWVGVFNRGEEEQSVALTISGLGFEDILNYSVFDIWHDNYISDDSLSHVKIPAHGVTFLKIISE